MVDSGNSPVPQTKPEGVFVGTFAHSLDPKKRFTIPAQWRAQVDGPGSLYVLPGVDTPSLCVFTALEMTRRLGSVGHHSIADRQAMQVNRVLASRSDLVSWDPQGRIRIKDDLLKYARIKDRVVLVGNFRFFEVWAPDILDGSGVLDQTNLADAVRQVGF